MSIDQVINKINDISRGIGAINGAIDALAPAAIAVNNSLNTIASTLTGDTYAPYPYPYPPMPVPPVVPNQNNSSIIGTVGKALAGGVAGYMYSETSSNIVNSGAGAVNIAKGLGSVALKGAGIGAAVGGGISAIENIVKVVRKEQSGAEAGGNITADLIGGAVSGAVGGTLGGAIGAKIGGLGGAIVGAAAGVGIDFLYRKSGLKDGIAEGVTKLLGGEKTYPYPPYPGYGYPTYPGYGYPYPMTR